MKKRRDKKAVKLPPSRPPCSLSPQHKPTQPKG